MFLKMDVFTYVFKWPKSITWLAFYSQRAAKVLLLQVYRPRKRKYTCCIFHIVCIREQSRKGLTNQKIGACLRQKISVLFNITDLTKSLKVCEVF